MTTTYPVGETLRRLRREARERDGIRYGDIVRHLGWSRGNDIAKFETGSLPLSLEMACRFAFVYGVSPSVLDSRLSASPLDSWNGEDGLHERIKWARVNAAMYPRELALAAFGSQNPDRIKTYESGKHKPCLWRVYAIAAAVQCRPSDLDRRLTDVIPPVDVVPLGPKDIYARGW